MWKRELLVVAARTSQGKSMFTLHLAKMLADKGETVAFFSLEMSKEQLVERLFTNICEINNLDLREGRVHGLVEERAELFLEWSKNIKLLIDDQNGYNFDKIVKVVKEIRPSWVFVDYVQMISMKGYKDKLSAMDEFIKEIHRLGKSMDFGTILVSQVNRQGVGEAGLHHLKNCGTLEEHSDSIFLLSWDRDKNQYVIRVEKNRHGACHILNANFQPQFSRFSDGEPFVPPMLPVKERKDWV